MTAVAALAAWVLNSVVGVAMFLRWLTRHHTRPAPPPLAFVHLATAVGGLALWSTYLAADRPAALAWATFVVLNVNNGLGDTLLTRGWRARHHRHEKTHRDYLHAVGDVMSGRRKTALAHGLLGGATYVLVLLAALGVAT